MASVKIYTDKIRKARYGKEVRSSIADSIDIINEESEAFVKKVNQAEANVNKAVTDAINATSAANTAASAATTAANNANEAAQAVFDEKYILTARTEFAKSARVSPTAKGNAILEKLRGDSWQKQLIGKNKFDITTMLSSLAKRNDGCFKNANGDTGSICNIPVVAGQTYTVTAYILGATTQSAWLRLSVQDGKDVRYTSFDDSIVTVVGLTTEYVKTVVTFTALSDWISISSLGSIRDDMQVELGETSTDFEEFCGNITSPNPSYEQKVRSVGDMGWFDGEWRQGNYNISTGEYISGSVDMICNVNPIPCKGGDSVRISHSRGMTHWDIFWYDDSGFIYRTSDPVTGTAPNGATYFNFQIYLTDITPSTVGHVCVTINGKYALIMDESNDNLFGGLAFANALVQSGATASISKSNKVVSFGGDSNSSKFSYANFKENTRYTFFARGYNDDTRYPTFTNFRILYTDNTFDEFHFITDATKQQVLVSKSGKTISKLFGFYASGIAYFYYEDFGIMEGVHALEDFVPHQSTRHYIPLDEPLRGINDVKDEMCCVDGVYEEYRPIIEMVFDGSDDEEWQKATSGFYTTAFQSILKKSQSPLSNQYLGSLVGWQRNTIGIAESGTIWVGDVTQTTIDEWKARLSENPLIVQAELANPTFAPFEDQTPFYNLMAFDEVTHVSIAGCHEELNPIVTMRFPRNEDGAMVTTNWCDNKKNEIRMNELTAALLALGRE